MKKRTLVVQIALLLLAFVALEMTALAATINTHHKAKSKHRVTETARARRRMSRLRRTRALHARRARRSRRYRYARRHRYYERFYTSSFSTDVSDGDITAGEDPIVRAAAVDALGNMNGTVVAIEPTSGRILAMVNQKLALSSGAMPCSTIKLSVALAALSEGVIDKETRIRLGRRFRLNLTQALAHSNNAYFEAVGRQLGFEKVAYYAHQFGLGELAGYNIPGEQLGEYPDHVIPTKDGGVGRMCSFGEGVSMTPLQLGALVSAIANGGTLYYLQHPTTPEQVTDFQPRIKRQLNIAPLIPEMFDGMAGAVEYGTARRVLLNFNEEQILGKTGTCSKDGTRFGWFASYANTNVGRIVVVVFLEGGRPTFGPKAAEIAGLMYRDLYDHSFFMVKNPGVPESTSSVQTSGATQ